MITRILTLLLSILVAFSATADVNTDKAMAKISRDTKNYISADVRATTEDEAYNEAMQKLSAKIADYFKKERSGETMPDAVYLSNISSIYERFTSKIADNRYRVMLYVKKSDLIPVADASSAIVLSKTDDNKYAPVAEQQPQQIVKTDTVVTVVKQPLSPTLSEISHVTTYDEMRKCLQSLRELNRITGASVFPVANALNYYIAVIDGNNVEAVLHFDNGKYLDILTSEEVNINKYARCQGFWFTLPNSETK